MTDITKCTGKGCKLKKKCYRFLAKADDWQAWFVEPPINKKTEKCELFWKVKGKK